MFSSQCVNTAIPFCNVPRMNIHELCRSHNIPNSYTCKHTWKRQSVVWHTCSCSLKQYNLLSFTKTILGCLVKAVTRSHVWWPRLDKNLEDVVCSCVSCQAVNRASPVAPLSLGLAINTLAVNPYRFCQTLPGSSLCWMPTLNWLF